MKNNFLTIAIALVVILIFTLGAQAQTPRETGTYIGNIIPEITLNDVNGNPISLSNLRSNIVLVDFWASWCTPCRRENILVVKTYQDFTDKDFKDAEGFKVFSVSLDKDKDDWMKAIEADGMTWDEHVCDLLGWRSGAAKKFKVRAIPMNYLIDHNGVIIAKNLRGQELENILNNLLAE